MIKHEDALNFMEPEEKVDLEKVKMDLVEQEKAIAAKTENFVSTLAPPPVRRMLLKDRALNKRHEF